MDKNQLICRYFSTYSGVQLPLNLLSELTEAEIANRNTYFAAYFNSTDQLMLCEKRVYGEVELTHCYEYHDNGQLKKAVVTDADEEENILAFDANGQRL
jgi:hypothetical protein